ncbi:hypothetical protein PF005_g28681 [Phytophthora fragariae]|uniref:Uncharacterized protein n=1 Tax=Phytophthora fragariae TaxID=53985 RepID=A0A6A3VL24_9STRA|nr:hypothetical protein PF003_g28817 [Phytophthora fragariae]KAE8924305.1 hypothetical protein PF009_g25465 [Phytophthora fragariae]KAE8971264.1 hypothetical protein PF011_g26100 [Phytophthora fragariae]KAE9068957.1 hypothetical protein PF007_g27499 [Phytophthora fragariae]KAE9070690.1 hypothetical protein PF006_g29308 [Phytophthora fragariae]
MYLQSLLSVEFLEPVSGSTSVTGGAPRLEREGEGGKVDEGELYYRDVGDDVNADVDVSATFVY